MIPLGADGGHFEESIISSLLDDFVLYYVAEPLKGKAL